ncbi:MAG: ATP-binding protein [Syntrophobacterales bacterium]|jgi:two-component system sensor kinase FixL|nr:ATP-binding protein [Syntrophobacterales bacterium]
MTTAPHPIRIAIVFDGREFNCQPVGLPFSLEGHPPVDIVLFGAQSEAGPAASLLPELHPEGFDLVLDGRFMAGGLPDLAPEQAPNLLSGPAADFLQGLVCQLQELRQKQEINAGIIMSATDGLVTINEDHVIIGYNHGAEQMFGYTRREALGQDLKLIVPPPFTELHGGFVKRYVATREAHVLGRQRRLNARRRDGTEFPLSISFSVAEIRGNLYFTAIMRDITEYVAMEERVLQTERLAAVGNTVAHIAHEIKNPLLIIGGFARQLIKSPGLDDGARQKLSIIAEEVSSLENLIAEMRDFVRRPPAQKRPGQIAGVIQGALELFQDTFKEHNIQVRQVEAAALPSVTFDPRQVHQVLVNLFKNALEAMPGGGEITISSQVKGDKVEISVTDTGAGLSPEASANIFRPYFTTKEKGTGLGLAICQSIMEEHGGCIFADSPPGRGATFTMQLPLEEASQEAGPMSAPEGVS